MELEVGSIVEGKVSGITKFGAFVSLQEGRSGLVHISELANAFVSDVNEHVQLGQAVRVKVLGISPEGKINLSMKRVLDDSPAERPAGFRKAAAPKRDAPPRTAQIPSADPPSADQAFEDRLKKFMQESDSRIADNRMYADRNRRSRRR